MASHLCLSFRFLDGAFHGRGDGGRPEWPPSPLRAFQALVQSAARSADGALPPQVVSTLTWLERRAPPAVVAPAGAAGNGYRLSVPNNAMDIVARAWCRGNESNSGDASPATHRTMKTVRPTWLVDGETVYYLWEVPDSHAEYVTGHAEVLSQIARSVVTLGWGIDMVVGDAKALSADAAGALAGERWEPCGHGAGGLRVPVAGTLDGLRDRHQGFLARLGPSGFTAPPALGAHATIAYRRAGDVAPKPLAAFSLLKLDATGFRPFDTLRRALIVAGMLRHAVRNAAERAGWDGARIDAFVLGHQNAGDGVDTAERSIRRRFAYVPMPSIEARDKGRSEVVGSVRRVLVCASAEDCEDEMAWLRRALPGSELVDERTGQPVAVVSLIPTSDRMVHRYLDPASSWATVTPVVLPGYDDPAHYRRRLEREPDAGEQRQLLDRLGQRVDGLLRKAITQAGYPRTLADHADLQWRETGFWPGGDLAGRYGVPDHLKRFPRLHVRLRWRDPQGNPVSVPGPVCLGGGRFYGLGLFAAWRPA
jgi:CRISPR-associated protein Csb2